MFQYGDYLNLCFLLAGHYITKLIETLQVNSNFDLMAEDTQGYLSNSGTSVTLTQEDTHIRV